MINKFHTTTNNICYLIYFCFQIIKIDDILGFFDFFMSFVFVNIHFFIAIG